ncbi:MAG: aminoacyl-tRNA hydrolase [Proteobacteria bacterium]|nr:aminoacyl-tRNA hydrolase [Pseudomonadota bacterium]
MKLIVGLGNPGKEYAGTRHNVGFMVADGLREAFGLPAFAKKCKGLASKGRVAGEDVVVLKPQTFMNVSGESVRAAVAFFKLKPSDVLVVHDELDVPLGQLKFKVGGGDAGHNGLKSITQHLGTPDYARLRFGIGRPVHKSQVSDYVLEPFAPAEGLVAAERVAWVVENISGLFGDPHGTLAKLKSAA